MKIIFFKLYMNFIGAVYMFKENTYQRPRRLPDYGQLGETAEIISSSWLSSWVMIVILIIILEGRTVVVTGGGRGIGEEAVKKFLRAGMKVICGVRWGSRMCLLRMTNDCGQVTWVSAGQVW